MHYFKRNEQKTCFFCHSKSVKKNGKVGSTQLYKCKDCGKQFRGVKRLDVAQLIDDYVFGCQSVNRLATKYKVSQSTIHRKLDSLRSTRIVSSDKQVVVLMDSTYWGWSFGVVVFKDARTGKILWRKFISKRETLADYQEGVDWLLANGFCIEGVFCDGVRGMFQLLSLYKVQMCQFHQVKIVKKHLTSKPDLEASKELLAIAKFMRKTDKKGFVGVFEEWAVRWSELLKERTIDRNTGKTHYAHSRLRSAYLSIKRNMPYLWTWYDNPASVGIPNTNNGLEGKFIDLKTKLRNHNGLSIKHRMIFIDAYFKGTYKRYSQLFDYYPIFCTNPAYFLTIKPQCQIYQQATLPKIALQSMRHPSRVRFNNIAKIKKCTKLLLGLIPY